MYRKLLFRFPVAKFMHRNIPFFFLLIIIQLLTHSTGFAQLSRVSGVITDSKGAKLEGVSINVKGTSIGTSTDSAGAYSMNVPSSGAVLIFSAVGHTALEEPVKGRSRINISLKDANSDLNEVVVIGYGATRSKRDLTGSIGTVSSKQISEKQPVNLTDALQGQVPGLLVISDNGYPSGTGTIQVRGASTINGGNGPLYVVDGALTNDYPSFINPQDIESIEVLKDASSAAIYGARGANGVVIITTKRGKAGKPSINATYTNLIGNLSHKLRTVNASELRLYRQMRGDGNNGGRVDSLNHYMNQDNDYQDLLFRTGHKQVGSVSVSGGQKGLTYYSGLTYTDDQSIVINSYIKRLQSRTTLDYQVSDKFDITNTTGFSYQTGNDINVGTTVKQVFERNPWTSIYLPDGSYAGYVESKRNPVAQAYYATNNNRFYSITDNLKLEYKILPDLKLSTVANIKYDIAKHIALSPASLTSGGTGDANGSNEFEQTFYWESQTFLNYNKIFNGRHTVGGLLGFSADQSRYDDYQVSMTNYLTEQIFTSNAAQTINLKSTGTSATAYSDASVFGRLNYAYSGKYLLEGSYRRDGSSRFGVNNRWGNFFSGSAAWRFADERFMDWSDNFLVDGKLRFSVGQTGNDRISNYGSYTTFNFGGEFYNGASSAALNTTLGNSEIKWETTTQQDAGIDLTLLRGRLNVTADYYKKTTSNLLYNKALPVETAFTNVYVNLGTIENTGWEFSVAGTPISNKKLTWTVNANFSMQNGIIKELANHTPFISGDKWLVREGGRIGDFYVYKNLGVYQYNESNAYTPDGTRLTPVFDNGTFQGYTLNGKTYTGDVRSIYSNGLKLLGGDTEWADINNDGVIDDKDRLIAGNGVPKYFFGFTNNIRYGSFSLNVLFSGNLGYQVYNGVKNGQNTNSSTYSPPSWDAIHYSWQKPGDISIFPYFPFKDVRGGIRNGLNSMYIEDGSFVRLASARLTYNLSPSIAGRAKLKGVAIFIYGNNLLTWTNYSWYDPEFSSSNILQPGNDNGKYPKRREYGFGVNLNL